SGTRVIRFTQPERRLRIHVRTLQPQLSRPPDLPERIGPFGLKGALRWTPRVSTLVGEDRALGRDVLIWVRPESAPALDATRRSLSRTSRLRWLACGPHGAQQWDAFL